MNYFLGQPIFLYIDPGTGSMLFVAILGVLSSLHFFLKKLWMKIKYSVGAGDKAVDTGKKDVVIFSEGKQYAYVFKDIVKILDKKGIKAEYWTTDEHDEVLKDEYGIDTFRTTIKSDIKTLHRLEPFPHLVNLL